jgi:NlpC/P60 family
MPLGSGASAPGGALAERFLSQVKSFQGVPYVWGGESRQGVDCSGLVQLAAREVGVSIPRTTTAQFAALPHVSAADAQPGDLVFFTGSDPPSPGHVGVVDSPGHWSMIDAPQTGQVVHRQPFSVPGMGVMHVVGFARLPGAGTVPSGQGGGGLNLFSLVMPPAALQFFDDAARFVNSAMWILNPENWMRLLAGAAGVLLALAGAGFLLRAA